MAAVERDALSSGAFLTSFQDARGIELWTEERIEDSMRDTLACRPKDDPVWLFAYGSLIWNPVIQFAESCPASLEGWRRSFCIRLVIARGSNERPGRMMSLMTGGNTAGLALRLDESSLERELRLVWMREMVGGAYRPTWVAVALRDGRTVSAIVFTANTDCALHEDDDRVDTVAPVIASANGPLGSNRDYVLQLDDALRHHGLEDSYIATLASKLLSASP